MHRQNLPATSSSVQDSRRAHTTGRDDESSPVQYGAEDVDKHAAQASAYIRAAAIKGPSNRHLVRLALKHRCLAGAHLARKQESVLRALDACQNSSQFLILFGKLNGNKFRGLYALEKRAKKGGSEGSGGGGSELSSSKSARKVWERPAKDYNSMCRPSSLQLWRSKSELRGTRARRRRRARSPFCLGATTSLGTLPRAAETGRPPLAGGKGPSRVECHVHGGWRQTGFSLLVRGILSRGGQMHRCEGRKAGIKQSKQNEFSHFHSTVFEPCWRA